MGLRDSGPGWLWARDTQGLLHRTTHNEAPGIPHSESSESSERKRQREREGAQNRRKPQSFCNQILEVTICFFCQILFIRGKSVNLVHVQGEGSYKGIVGGRDLWDMLESATVPAKGE